MEGQTTLARGSLNRKRDYEFQGQKEHQKVLVVGDQMGKDGTYHFCDSLEHDHNMNDDVASTITT